MGLSIAVVRRIISQQICLICEAEQLKVKAHFITVSGIARWCHAILKRLMGIHTCCLWVPGLWWSWYVSVYQETKPCCVLMPCFFVPAFQVKERSERTERKVSTALFLHGHWVFRGKQWGLEIWSFSCFALQTNSNAQSSRLSAFVTLLQTLLLT